MRFTLDTNCLIDVEEGRPSAPFVRELVSFHGQNGINVAVSAIGASERQRAGGYAQNFSEFQEKLKVIGFDTLELLLPLAYWDVCFWDHCVCADENDAWEQEIHNVLFPNIEFMWVDYAKTHGLAVDSLDKNWRNAKCDVLALWCHIKHGDGVFVTSDGNFHAVTKRDKLRALGVGTIAYPKDALPLAQNPWRYLWKLYRMSLWKRRCAPSLGLLIAGVRYYLRTTLSRLIYDSDHGRFGSGRRRQLHLAALWVYADCCLSVQYLK